MPPNNSPTILVVGDAIAPTGFSRVTRAIIEPLVPRFSIHQLAVNYFGDPHELPWKLYPASIGGDPVGRERLPALFDHIRPDLVFLVGSLPGVQAYLQSLDDRAKSVPIVAYCPVEAEPIPPERVPALKNLDRLVFYTEFAKREFELAAEQCEEHRDQALLDSLLVMPHGVDSRTFYPLERDEPDRDAVKRRIKQELFSGDKEHAESFVVLNANRNQRRKRMDLTIRGFAEFARDKDRYVKLYLHMGSKDIGWDVVSLCRRFGIFDRLIVTNRAKKLPWVSSEELNMIYNAADVGINTSSSEGWGLVSFEHAATIAAQLVPRHASCAELWSGSAEMMEPSLTLTDPDHMTDQHLVSPEEVAAGLERLFQDDAHRRTVAERCYARATDPELQWGHISKRWEGLFDELLATSPD